MLLPALATVHDTFLTLSRIADEQFAGSCARKLLLRSGFDPTGIAVVVAASVAGAATLCIDADADALRSGLRAGLCDFVVAHLDEALRILKNEIRRGVAVSVGLTADPRAALSEMSERGVQPDLLNLSSADAPAAISFRERGALDLPSGAAFRTDSELLSWTIAVDPPRNLPRLTQIAIDALDPAHPDSPARRRWLEVSPRYLGRAFGSHQCLRMTSAESSVLADRIRVEVPAAILTHEDAAS